MGGHRGGIGAAGGESVKLDGGRRLGNSGSGFGSRHLLTEEVVDAWPA
jgi:hypothetical protein